jgi:hypothetical protein
MDTDWIESIKGYRKDIMTIGYVDLLGISEDIIKLPTNEVADKYVNTYIAELAAHLFLGGEEITGEVTSVKHFQFSDSILFIGGASSGKDVRLTVAIISGMMRCLMNNWGIPARGAISIGEFCIIEKLNVYVGKPLVEAALIESATDWVGLSFLKPKGETSKLLNELKKYHWLSKFQVPIKSDKKDLLLQKGISADKLVPVRWFIEENQETEKNIVSKLKELKGKAPDKNSRGKIQNGLSFIQRSLNEYEG